MGYVSLRELTGYIRGVGAHCEQRRTPVAQGRKKARLNPQFRANSLFLYASFGPSSTNIPRTSFLIIYALQLLSISNHTFILAQNNLPRSAYKRIFHEVPSLLNHSFYELSLSSSTENTLLRK